MSFKWPDSKVLTFIQLYENLPCLWNISDPEYKDKNVRQAAIDEIIVEVDVPNLTVADVKNKIKNLRSHYLQELKKVRESERNAVAGNPIYEPTVPWFNTLHSFLSNIVQHRSSSESKTTVNRKRKQKRKSSLVLKAEISESTSDQSSMDEVPEVALKMRRVNDLRTSTSIDRPGDVPAVPFNSQRPTEFDIFGQSVAAQLNNMPFTEALDLQLRIQQTITQHRQRLYKFNRDSLDN